MELRSEIGDEAASDHRTTRTGKTKRHPNGGFSAILFGHFKFWCFLFSGEKVPREDTNGSASFCCYYEQSVPFTRFKSVGIFYVYERILRLLALNPNYCWSFL